MTRNSVRGGLGLLVAAAAAAGCHHPHTCRGVPPAAAPAVPAAASVVRVDGIPVGVPVPPAGLPLRDALAQSKAVAAAAPAVDPAYLFAVLDRPEGRYAFSLPAVTDTAAGTLRLGPGETVSLVRWENTDLVRGLDLKSLEKAVAPPPPPPNLLPLTLVQWADQVIEPETVTFLPESQLPTLLTLKTLDATFKSFVDQPSHEAEQLARVLQKVGVFIQPVDYPRENSSRVAVDQWYADVVVPAVRREAERRRAAARGRLVQPDWAALAPLYTGRPADAPVVLAVRLTLDGQPVEIPRDERTVRLPPQAPPGAEPSRLVSAIRRGMATHPSVGSAVAASLDVKAEDAVAVIRREVGGRPTEFVLALPPDQGTSFTPGAQPAPSAKRRVLLSTLLFDGDQVDVTSPMRLPVVLTSALAPLVRQTMAPAAAPARPHRLFHHKDACPPPAAPVPVVPAPVPVPVLP